MAKKEKLHFTAEEHTKFIQDQFGLSDARMALTRQRVSMEGHLFNAFARLFNSDDEDALDNLADKIGMFSDGEISLLYGQIASLESYITDFIAEQIPNKRMKVVFVSDDDIDSSQKSWEVKGKTSTASRKRKKSEPIHA